MNHRGHFCLGPGLEGRVPRTIFDGGAGSSFSSVHRKTLSRIQRTSSSDLGSSSRNEPVGDSERNREKILSGPVALDESLRVYNPLTKRTIRRHGTSDDAAGKKWHAFMYIEGGYIAISTLADKILSEISAPYELVPLNLEMLALWNDNHSHSCSSSAIKEISASSLNKTTSVQNNALHPTLEPSIVLEAEIESSANLRQNEIPSATIPLSAQDCAAAYDILFVYKPSGLLTLPGIGPDKADCLASRINDWLESADDGIKRMRWVKRSKDGSASIKKKKKKRSKQRGPYVPRPCHRLDYDTSGIIAVALSSNAQRCGQLAFQERWTDKTYVALVAGHMKEDKGVVDLGIGKVLTVDENGQEFGKWACEKEINKNDFIEGSIRSAKTEYQVSARLSVPVTTTVGDDVNDDDSSRMAKYTRVTLKPITGRGHQLRLHMESMGHPILGDLLHAPAEVAKCAPRLCLHAETLAIPVQSPDGKVEVAVASYPAPF